MKTILLILGNIWMFPNTVISALYLSFFWALGWIEFEYISLKCIQFNIIKDTWLYKKMKPAWGGWTSGIFIMIKEDKQGFRLYYHELRHVQQQMVLGIFQPILYIISGLINLCKGKRFYYDNLFEIDARGYAMKIFLDMQNKKRYDLSGCKHK